jgi:hypothetical protein
MYRWSLIAARLPGRTANDVKNYWHTNLRKKVIPKKEENEEKEKSKESMIKIKSHEIIKPRPRTLSTHSLWLKKKHNLVSNGSAAKLVISSEDGNVPRECDKTILPNIGDACVGNLPLSTMWWESLLNVDEERSNDKIGSCSLLQEENFTLEFSNVEEFFTNGSSAGWDFNLCDINSFGVSNGIKS